MKIRITLVASAALAAVTLIPVVPAAAGGGVRLNFGGPLGTFTARPFRGENCHPGQSYPGARLARAHKNAIAERKAALRRARIAEARQLEEKRQLAAKKAEELARRKAVAAAKVRAEERAEKVAAAKTTSEGPAQNIAANEKAEDRGQAPADIRTDDKIEVAKADVSQTDPAGTVEKIERVEIAEAVQVKASPVTGANSLIPVAAIKSETAGDEVQLKPIDVETKAGSDTKVAAVVSSSEPQKSNEPQSCKKFVPSAGLTITVPCGN